VSDDASIDNCYTEHIAPHLRVLLPAIFAQLGDNQPAPPPLLRVCGALWRNVPIDVLLRINTAAQRQPYADVIQNLSLR
jgi:hypothetical protein